MAEGTWSESIHRRSLMLGCLTGAVTAGLKAGSLHAFSFFAGGESKVTHGDLKNWKSMPDLKGFEAAFEFLDKKSLAEVPVGKHPIEGEQVYALVQKLPSRAAETAQFESHRKYVDVHYMVSGQETSGFAPAGDLKLAVPYDESKDVMWVIVLSCLIKPIVQAELGRYSIATGETGLAGFNLVPGPRWKVNWIVWAWHSAQTEDLCGAVM